MAESQLSDEDIKILEEMADETDEALGAPSDEPQGQQEPPEETPADTEKADVSEDAPPDDSGKQDMVPHAQFHAKNEQFKQVRDEFASYKTLMEDRFQQLQQSLAPKEDEAKPPTLADDPFGYVQHIGQTVEQQQQALAQQRELGQRLTQAAQFATPYVERFRAQQPDYDDAYQHVMQTVAQAAQLSGADPKRQLADFEMGLVGQAQRTGQDPAAIIYQLAGQVGYQPKATEQPAQEQKSAADNVVDLKEKSEKHRSLSSAAGGGAPATLSAKVIADMSPEEFSDFLASRENYDKVNAIIGG